MQATNQTKAGTAKTQAVEFKYHAPDAQLVFVAGTFNAWKPDVSPLARDKTGNWRASLQLPAGRHEFKFVVDGRWCCDPACVDEQHGCPNCCPNPFGTMNRILEVS